MRKINLLAKLPRGKRNVCARAEAKTEQIIAISRSTASFISTAREPTAMAAIATTDAGFQSPKTWSSISD